MDVSLTVSTHLTAFAEATRNLDSGEVERLISSASTGELSTLTHLLSLGRISEEDRGKALIAGVKNGCLDVVCELLKDGVGISKKIWV